MRIAAISLLFGGIAGALSVSGIIALRHSDRAAMEFAEGSAAPASKDRELGTGPSVDAREVRPEIPVGTAAPHASAEESPVQGSAETSAPAADVAPKPRMVRARRTVESPAIARVPLGRREAPAAASPGDAPESTQASNAAPAGNDVPAAAAERAGVRPGAREAANSLPPKKKVQKTVRTASSRRDILESDSFWRDGRTDDWGGPHAPASADVRGATAEEVVLRTGAREGHVDSSGPKAIRNGRSGRNDTGNDSFWSFWRDERTDDWSTRAAVPASADARGATPERTADTRKGPREGFANSSAPKKALKTFRNTSSRSDDTNNDSFWRDERQDDWRARAAAVNDGRSAAGPASARESNSSLRGFWNWSR
jgi:hypothetical protein